MNKVEANSTDKKGKRSEDYGALAGVHGEMQGGGSTGNGNGYNVRYEIWRVYDNGSIQPHT